MSKFTLKTFCGTKQIERFDHRSPGRMNSILEHPRHHRAGETGPWGEIEDHPDRFEIFDSQMEKIFSGNISEAIIFVKRLR